MTRPILIMALVLILFPSRVRADIFRASEVKIWNSGHLESSFEALKGRAKIAAGVAVYDVTSAAPCNEIIIASGSGTAPLVRVLSPAGKELFAFMPFAVNVRGGILIAAGDTDGDSIAEIIALPRFESPAEVRVFNVKNLIGAKKDSIPPHQKFTAFTDHGAISLAVHDLNNDERDEIIVGSAPGVVSEVRIFRPDGTLTQKFFPFDSDHTNGVVVAGLRTANPKKPLLAVAEASQGSRLRIFRADRFSSAEKEWLGFDSDFIGGLTLSAVSNETEMTDALIVSVAGAGGPHVRVFSPNGRLLKEWFAFEKDFRGGVALASGQLDADSAIETVTVPTMPLYEPPAKAGKSITISLPLQRLFAWENGYLKNTFLISSGIKKFPTPVGEFKIITKPLFVNYTHSYGPNNPDNYSFPNTKFNLMFSPHYYIHSAYWHNDFGIQKSHGCVNAFKDDAEWSYVWADIGTSVQIIK